MIIAEIKLMTDSYISKRKHHKTAIKTIAAMNKMIRKIELPEKVGSVGIREEIVRHQSVKRLRNDGMSDSVFTLCGGVVGASKSG